jgi:hypothetical protein
MKLCYVFCILQSFRVLALQFSSVPSKIANSKRASFTFGCNSPTDVAPVDGCLVRYALDGSPWSDVVSEASFTLNDLAEGKHVVQLRHEHDTATVQYEWLIDTVPPETFIDAAPTRDNVVYNQLDTEAFSFFTFHCSEPSCTYHSPNGELYGLLQPVPLPGAASNKTLMDLTGQVSVTQLDPQSQSGSSLKQLSVFISVGAAPKVPQHLLPRTLILRNNSPAHVRAPSALAKANASAPLNVTLPAPEVRSGCISYFNITTNLLISAAAM